MISFKKISDIKHYLASLGLPRQQIGFVPTMGALHEGHIALIRKARSDNKLVVCSIFVNPTQFNEPSDYEHYPKTLQEDTSKLIDAGCDLLFAPSVAEMYPDGTHNMEQYEIGRAACRERVSRSKKGGSKQKEEELKTACEDLDND